METTVVGPGIVGTPYGAVLSDLLGSKALREAIVVSAFLTEEGAERLVDALRRSPRKARVNVVVGSMAGFTRKAAVRYLQSFVTGRNRRLLSAKLGLLHPFEQDPQSPTFHAKAVYTRVGKRTHRAVVGSHNLTIEGLDSNGELGIFVDGSAAKSIGEALEYWSRGAIPWSKYLPRYKEAKRIPGVKQGRRRPQTSNGYLLAGLPEELDSLTPAQERRADRLLDEHDRVHGSVGGAWHLLVSSRDADDYPPGIVFDAVDGENGWNIGSRRGIARVVRYFPDPKSSDGLVIFRWLIRYRVTDSVIKLARKYRVFGGAKPTGEQLWQFEKALQAAKVRRWTS
jgi:hypothetical protein